MAGGASCDPLRLEQLFVQLDGMTSSLESMGPDVATVALPGWLRQVASGLLKEVEGSLPDPDFFSSLGSGSEEQGHPSELATRAGHCWELAVLLSIARAAIGMYLEEWTPPMGFGPKAG